MAGVWQSGTDSFTLVAVGGGEELLYRQRVDGVFRGSELVLGAEGWWMGSVHPTQGMPGGSDDDDAISCAESQEDEAGLARSMGWFRVRFERGQHGEDVFALSQACGEDVFALS